MAFDNVLVASNISASGLTAERLRMEVIANNVANALATRTSGGGGGAYRRQEILFEAIMQEHMGGSTSAPALGGVRVLGVVPDESELPRIHDPGHPDADGEGFVTMPNVFLPIEMVNLMTASRAYEANLKVLQSLRQQLEQTLSILRG